ncbi:MAG: aminoacetone oxidase family FAD-binding enzyme [Patescibacteria group bacterium]
MNKNKKKIWDVAVIGGGPAGMMAAGRAAELGASVILLEKNNSLGKKLLISGGGRCNLTNAEFNVRKFLSKFKESDKFLFSAFSQWDAKNTIDFFNAKDMQTKVEDENRVFPVSDSAKSVWSVLVKYMRKGGVTISYNSPVSGFIKYENKIKYLKLENGDEIHASSFILATGGSSRPETGSTGDGCIWLHKIGHNIIDTNPALVPIVIKDPWIKRLQGVSLKNVKITVSQNDKKELSKEGKILFTHFGLSGPAILNLSKDVGELLKYGVVTISLDLMPLMDYGVLDIKIQEMFVKNINKKFTNSLDGLFPDALTSIIVWLSNIDKDKFCHSISRAERLALGKLIKNIPMQAVKLLGVKKAIITSGGVDLKEVDFKNMRSRLFKNLYIVGDMLNIDKPSGGYSLQLCWTTGYIAGNASAKKDD